MPVRASSVASLWPADRWRGWRGALRATAATCLIVSVVSAAPQARDILDRRYAAERTDRRWTDRVQRVDMVIKGQTDEHAVQLEMYDQRPANDEARTAVFILAPPDIAGRGYLARHHADRIPDVLYFSPKTLRLRPLGANAALEGVEQSDLTYRDLDLLQKMQGWSADDVSATLLREERVDGVDTHVIALQPKDQGVADRRLVVWLAEDDLVARQVDIFDDGDATPRRRIHQRQIEMVGNVPVAREVEVESPRERTRTILHIREIKFDSGVDESVFHEDAFKRRVH